MARGDFPSRHCKIIFQSIDVPKLAVPRSTRGHDGRSKRQAGRYAKQRRHRNRHAMDTLTLRPGGSLSRQRRICGTPSVLVFHFTPRSLRFCGRSRGSLLRAPQPVSQCERSAPRRSRGRNLDEEQCAASRSLDWDSRNHRRGSASGDISRGAIGRARKRHQHRRIT